MTRKIFRLMFLAGVLLLGNLFAGCGAFGGKNNELTNAKLQNANLRGQLDRANRDVEDLEQDKEALEADLDQATADNNELERQLASKPSPGPASAGTRKITVPGSVLFKAGSATLTTAGKRELGTVAGSIRSRYPGQHISVEGHTDSSPLRKTLDTWKTNMWLSANRANAVANHLISQGIAENLVSVRGWGAGMPTGRGANQDRRVEIVILSR